MNDQWGLTKMTRVEIVVGGEDMSLVAELLSEVGATGFTAVSNVSGLGHSGFHQGRLLFNDRNSMTMLTVVLPPERTTALLDGLRSLFSQRSGVLFVSDTWVSRPEYFQ